MEIETQNESRYKARAAYFSKYRKDRRAEKQSTLEFYEENIERYEASNQSDKKKKRASLATFDSSRYPIGFNPVIMNRKTGGVSRMPTEFAFILKACEELIDNKRRFPSLYQRGGEAMNKRNVRVQMAKFFLRMRTFIMVVSECQQKTVLIPFHMTLSFMTIYCAGEKLFHLKLYAIVQSVWLSLDTFTQKIST